VVNEDSIHETGTEKNIRSVNERKNVKSQTRAIKNKGGGSRDARLTSALQRKNESGREQRGGERVNKNERSGWTRPSRKRRRMLSKKAVREKV